MNLTTLNTSLSTLGTVDLLEEVSGKLLICVKNFTNSLENINSFNTIASNEIIGTYPNIEAVSFEGDSIKGIFTL